MCGTYMTYGYMWAGERANVPAPAGGHHRGPARRDASPDAVADLALRDRRQGCSRDRATRFRSADTPMTLTTTRLPRTP